MRRDSIVAAIHEQYLAAGAHIIETNTVGGTTIAQADFVASKPRSMT
jgi:5-methyltetrahydrofolate--homocysteine methyltransferase